MITLSSFVVLGIIEVYALFVSGLLVLVVYNRSLRQSIINLRTQLIKLKKTLRKDSTTIPKETKDPSFLANEIGATSTKFSFLAPDKDIEKYQENDIPTQVASLRYQFLLAEQNATKSTTDDEKWTSLQTSLLSIIEQIKAECGDVAETRDFSGHDKNPLKENWMELGNAALLMWDEKSSNTEENLMGLFQVINSDLGFDQLEIPARKPPSEQKRQAYNKNVDTVIKLKHSADENKKLIESLLTQKDAAESEVSIKTSELQKLKRFFNES
jgi:hypothetical protein